MSSPKLSFNPVIPCPLRMCDQESVIANQILIPCDPSKHLTSEQSFPLYRGQADRAVGCNSEAKSQGSFVICEALAENSEISSEMAELYHAPGISEYGS